MTHLHGGLASARNLSLATGAHPLRWTRCFLLIGALAVATQAVAQNEQSLDAKPSAILSGETLEDLVEHALRHNPEIRAAIAGYEAAAQAVPQATAWPNPQLSLRYFARAIETRTGPQDYAFGFSQALPWRNRLRLQGEAASDLALATAAEIDEVRARVASEVEKLWIELSLLARSSAIVQANRDLVVSFESVARTRFATGSARHPDVIRAQIELGNIENQLASLNDRSLPLRAALNAALGRPPHAQIPIPGELELRPIRRSDQDLFRELATQNPSLRQLGYERSAAEARLKHAQTASLPEFTVGLDYIVIDKALAPNVRGSGNDPVSLSLRITLPTSRGKFRAQEREAEASLAAMSARESAAINALRAELMSILFELRDAERDVVLHRTVLLPKAEEALGALQRAYSGGAASFAELIEAQRVQLELELGETRALARHNLAHAQLDEILGSPSEVGAQGEEL